MADVDFGPGPLDAVLATLDPPEAVPWAPVGDDLAARRRIGHDAALVADPALVRDPTLGVAVTAGTPAVGSIAVLGDSISHGVQGGVVARPEHAWPTLLGRRLGVRVRIARPRRFAAQYLETALLLAHDRGRTLADDVAAAWRERRRDPVDEPPDVLAVSGFDLDDALDGPRSPNGYSRDVLGPFASPLAALEHRCDDEVPDLLVVMLGANCVLRSVVTLDARWSVTRGDEATVWTPGRFAQRFDELVGAVLALGIPNVVLTTVPHVSVAPLTRGQHDLRPTGTPGDQPYFPTYRWIFDDGAPSLRELSGATVERIDRTIDVYNRVVRRAVQRAREDEGRNVLLFDLCGLLDHVALRRNAVDGGPRRRAFPTELFAGLARPGVGDHPDEACHHLDSRFTLTGDASYPDEGGLVSLDGVHPSAAGQLVIARALAKVLAAGGMAVPPDTLDVRELLGGDPLLRSFADPGAPPLPTRRWLALAGTLEGFVDGVA